MKSTAKFSVAVLTALCVLSACNRPKEWTINGSFDVPDTIQYGDTFFIRPALDGTSVYMLSLDGAVIDTAVVENETFTFSGTAEEPRMRYLACEYCIGTVVIEPGTINVIMSENFEASGTPNNDGISRLESRMVELQAETREKMLAQGADDSVSVNTDSLQMVMYGIYFDLMNNLSAMIDSTAEAHPDDMVGVYAWSIKIGSVENLSLLDTMLTSASDYVRNSEMIQVRRQYIMNTADDNFDPEAFDLEFDEEGGMPGPPPGEDDMPGPPPGEDDMPGPPPGDEDMPGPPGDEF